MSSASSKILIVEDNDFVRMQIVGYLKGLDCEILEARDGEAALESVGAHRPDLSIVDVRMEPMGGFDFIRAVRSEGNKMPVVLVTGDQTPDILEQAGRYDVAAVLMKPVEKARLLGVVARVAGLKE